MMGIRINAFMADMRLDMIRYMKTVIIAKPAIASVFASVMTYLQ